METYCYLHKKSKTNNIDQTKDIQIIAVQEPKSGLCLQINCIHMCLTIFFPRLVKWREDLQAEIHLYIYIRLSLSNESLPLAI